MPVIHQALAGRDASPDTSDENPTFTPTMQKLLMTLLVLFFFSAALIAVLFVLRARRRSQKSKGSVATSCQCSRPSSRASHHRSLNILSAPFGSQPKEGCIRHEKEILIDNDPPVSTSSTVPEIHITFPDDESILEKEQRGRVVVVKMGENGGVGLEPYNDEHLPAYRKEPETFHSLDLERMGGLKEKENIKI